MQKDCLTIIPVFNEKNTVTQVVEKTLHHASAFSDILLVDDGSSDGSTQILLQLQKKYPQIFLILKEKNYGYGASLNSGFQFAIEKNYSFWITMDCDEQHQPKDLIRFQEIDPKIELVSGTRYHPNSKTQGIPSPKDRVEINHRITKYLNAIYNLQITDAFCGFKRYKREAFANYNFKVTGYSSPMELWTYITWKKISFTEIAVDRIYITDDRSFGEDLDKKRKRYKYYLQTWKQIHRELFGENLSLKIYKYT
jgi:dolichol-phosphate mannosyltransferase